MGGVEFAGSVEHDVASAVVLGEGDAVADAVETGHDWGGAPYLKALIRKPN